MLDSFIGADLVYAKGMSLRQREGRGYVFYMATFLFFHGALRPQKRYGLLGTGERMERGEGGEYL